MVQVMMCGSRGVTEFGSLGERELWSRVAMLVNTLVQKKTPAPLNPHTPSFLFTYTPQPPYTHTPILNREAIFDC